MRFLFELLIYLFELRIPVGGRGLPKELSIVVTFNSHIFGLLALESIHLY